MASEICQESEKIQRGSKDDMRFEQDFKDILKYRLESGTVKTFDDEVTTPKLSALYGVFGDHKDYGTKENLEYTLNLFTKPNDNGKIPDFLSSIVVTTPDGNFTFNDTNKKTQIVYRKTIYPTQNGAADGTPTGAEVLVEFKTIYYPILKKLEFWIVCHLPTKEENPNWGILGFGLEDIKFTCTIHYYDKIQKYNIHAVNDLFFKAENFIKGDNDVIMVVQGGNVTKSNIPEYDLNTMPLIVNFVVPLIRKNEFMSFLGGVAEEYNGKLEEYNGWLRGDKDDVITQYRAIYNTPFVMGESQEIRCGTGTIKICTVQWIISLNYGKNAYVKTPTVNLIINGVSIPIAHIMRYEHAYAPAYDDYQKFGNKIRTAKKLSAIRTWVFQIAKITLSESTKSEITRLIKSPKLFDSVIKEITNDDEKLQFLFEAFEWGLELTYAINLKSDYGIITVNHLSVSSGIENNSGSYLLTLEV